MRLWGNAPFKQQRFSYGLIGILACAGMEKTRALHHARAMDGAGLATAANVWCTFFLVGALYLCLLSCVLRVDSIRSMHA